MPSPQASATSSPPSCEERVEGTSHLDVPTMNPKNIMAILKDFSLLGRLHSKINFIFTCITLSLIPIGFKLKWSEQTGFKDVDLIDKIDDTLRCTSLNLLHVVLNASKVKFQGVLSHLRSLHPLLPPNDWTKGLKNYQFLFNIYSTKHQKKLKSLNPRSNLLCCIPSANLFPENPSVQNTEISTPGSSSKGRELF